MHLHLFWTWLVERTIDPAGMWPWAERNQGTLSMTALIVALGIAVFEVKRAAWSERRILQEYIDFMLSAADRGIELTRDAINTIDGTAAVEDKMSPQLWAFLQDNALSTLQEVQALRPANPRLAISVKMLERALSLRLGSIDGFAGAPRDELAAILSTLESMRGRLAAQRPKSDIVRLKSWLHRLFVWRNNR